MAERAKTGRYARAAGAPRGLRRVMKAGEIERALSAVDQWAEVEGAVALQRLQLVESVRARGGSWDSIGWLLGTTGGAVRKRFGGRHD